VREELREPSACPGARLVVAERDVVGILLRAPWEGEDAVEPEDMVDAEEVKHLARMVDALAPPTEIGLPEAIPPV